MAMKWNFCNTFVLAMLGVLLLPALSGEAPAQSRVPSLQLVKKALIAAKDQWVQFRNYNGKQLVYFTGLLTWKCGLREIRYSVNSKALGETFPLPRCNVDVPFNIDPTKDKVYLTFHPGGAASVSVQIVYKDGTQSQVRTYKPCDVEGDTTCGKPAE